MSKQGKKRTPSSKYSFILPLFILFVIIQLVGLYLGAKIIFGMPDLETVEGAEWGIIYFIQILIGTGLVLLALKYFKKGLKVFIYLGMFVFIFSFFELLLWQIVPDPLGSVVGFIAALAILLKLLLKHDDYTQSLALLLMVIFAGAMLGAVVGLLPVILFVVLLSIYDYIAVFKTKHMITLAKGVIEEKLPMVAVIPTKEHTYYLGGGDKFVPLMLSVSVLRHFNSVAAALLVLTGSCIGMISLFYYLASKEKKPLPGLPPIVFGGLCGLLIYIMLLMIGIKL